MDTKKIEEAVKMIIEQSVKMRTVRTSGNADPHCKDVPRNLFRTRADSRRAPV